MAAVTTPTATLLDSIEEAFGKLPMRIEVPTLGAPSSLPEARALLLRTATTYADRDQVMAAVLERAQHDQKWVLGLAGMLMPSLRHLSRRLERDWSAERDEVHAELLLALSEVVATGKEIPDRVASRLSWAIYNRASRALAAWSGRGRGSMAQCPLEAVDATLSSSPQLLVAPRDPEDVVEDGVREGALTPGDAELIVSTRLDNRRVVDLATRRGVAAHTLVVSRRRAEARLVTFLGGRTVLASRPTCGPRPVRQRPGRLTRPGARLDANRGRRTVGVGRRALAA